MRTVVALAFFAMESFSHPLANQGGLGAAGQNSLSSPFDKRRKPWPVRPEL
jgi:hypothetical protein